MQGFRNRSLIWRVDAWGCLGQELKFELIATAFPYSVLTTRKYLCLHASCRYVLVIVTVSHHNNHRYYIAIAVMCAATTAATATALDSLERPCNLKLYLRFRA